MQRPVRSGPVAAIPPRLLEAVLFAGVGALNTGIDILVFTALVTFTATPPLLASAVGYACGALNSYVVNGRLTFRRRDVRLASARRIAGFVLVNLLCLGFSLVVLALAAEAMPLLAAKLLSVVMTFALSFVLSRTLVYAA
ncbi:GtrA family protein [Muricoccus pecuniae]|uniref:Putative flippase GtrA n=1 Tax=Muricoccus pecuniae TaxID=693023 RepID=A0A840YIV2_9PROT|nr:GtrA family protein [Roseomonas pecuniae]MBB5694562.1 putative flippase GtrA [Roseomonas pecuniae]